MVWCVCDIMPVELELQRTTERAEIWTLLEVIIRLPGPAGIYTNNRGAVQDLNKGEAECTSANYNDADSRVRVWWEINYHIEQDLKLKVAWVRTHTTAR